MEITSKFEWSSIDWHKAQSVISKLQRRIYRASQNGNLVLARKLQKILTKSMSAKLVAVRKVTQDNQGKSTSGVDGVKSIKPKQRLELAKNLEINTKADKIRRVYIPKKNGEKRGLGIPTISDRAKQALMKMALEPEWEARFEPNSYGFRPQRSAWDAVEAIKKTIIYKPKYVLDADIEKCFDKISHNKLINKATQISKFQKQIKAWLKSGILDNGLEINPKEGTPQGGVISPLLANIALHGMEEEINKHFPQTKERYIKMSKQKYGYKVSAPTLIRYADDFVILCEDINIIIKCKEIIENWLKDWGLNLKESKTKIVHTKEEAFGNNAGFDFLGFNIRQYEKGKKHTNTFSNGNITKRLEYKTLIKPSKESIKRHYKNLADLITKGNGIKQEYLINSLQKRITGWCNYYKYCNSKETFTKLNHLVWKRLLRWGVRRHQTKGTNWVVNKYWKTINGRKWEFTDGNILLKTHDKFKSGERFIKIKGNKSPYDGDEQYWNKRTSKLKYTSNTLNQKLYKQQKGLCGICHSLINNEDLADIHHIISIKDGGTDELKNYTLAHKHCHQKLHGDVA
ncbi:group II intron reverse transcriptase/maturase [Cyanobacterium sp. IPPAS B-1200]|uniref:group II intron reverse transcriptase/maturase n=1 Tax=Cyanobacterium sp. IPPAS B-1200 TaxID=1562720 RepID=UPI0008527741|nr:group II intron reverse transcriptase/maturase [Cyanobacterium sp. IPPAS B-1200]